LYTVAKFHLSNNVDYTVVIECMQLVFVSISISTFYSNRPI